MVQIAKADLQKIAESISQAQGVYKQLKDQRQQLSAAVEALKLMSEWQARPRWHLHSQVDSSLARPLALLVLSKTDLERQWMHQ